VSYTVLARKYRPQSFADLVGQEHVARTLSNAIESDRVAHAFLFTGVRGVGKTTTARLLAKALNCEKGPTPTPCNECSQCTEITAGVDLDVLEMDGASNNSVEDVRRLQESIPYRPARDRFKIIIVDEVHMLSSGAFNAFLKTLEEPPPHVKFVFATTESHKVPITIRSRCQRYDFRLIRHAVIAERVRTILTAEGLKADEDAVAMVAREAAGSMRDALTLLDQIVALGGKELRGVEVAETLGIAGAAAVRDAARAMLHGEGTAVLAAVDALATQGLDMLHFAKQLLEYLRELVVVKVASDAAEDLVSLVDEDLAHARELAEGVDVLELQRAFTAVSVLVDDVGASSAPRTVLEMGMVRIATRPPLRQVAELVARLDALERRLGGAGGGGGREARRAPADAADRGGRGTEVSAATAPVPTRADPYVPTLPAPRAPEPAADAVEPPPEVARIAAAAMERAAQREAVEPPTAASAAADPPPVVQEVPPGAAGTLKTWEQILGQLRHQKPALAAILEHGVPLTLDRERIVIGFPAGSFYGQQAAADDARAAVSEAASTAVGARPTVTVELNADSDGRGRTIAQVSEQRRNEEREEARRSALGHPRVQEALQVFHEGAANVRVHVDPDRARESE
jgi:DNA polymerase-3 subunit gamma/tau